jgi:hypothetical protein
VSATSYLIFVSGLALELLVVYRLLRGVSWCRYPFFFCYAVYLVAQTMAEFGILCFMPVLYTKVYWYGEGVNVLLRFFVIWEVFRYVFVKSSVLHEIASRGFMFGVSGMIVLLVAISWGAKNYETSHSVFFASYRTLGLCQAFLILAILVLAQYYNLHLGRNLWGIAVGFGLFSSFSIVNFALIDLAPSLIPYWQLLIPFGFVSMLCMWTWAIWDYSPNQVVTDGTLDHIDIEQWSENWSQALSAIRRVIHP